MTEPVSRKEFYDANEKIVKSIKDHVDSKFKSHAELEKLRHETIDKVLAAHSKTLYGDGNGNKGLNIKVDRLSVWMKAATGGVTAAVAAGATYLGLK